MKTINLALIALGVSLVTSFAVHSDEWICNEEASVRSGNSIHSCGVATGADENEARKLAYENSMAEFKRVCEVSSDCYAHDVTVTPKRTTCDETDTGFKCYRMVYFTINESVANPKEVITHKSAVPMKTAKVYTGMSKSGLFAAFGLPTRVLNNDFLDSGIEDKSYAYPNQGDGYNACWIKVRAGKVVSTQNCKPELIADL